MQPGICYTVSQSDEGLALLRIEVSVTAGNGKLNISGTTKSLVKDNIKNIHQYIKANEKSILSQEHSLKNYDLSIEVSSLIGSGIGPGIGASVFVSFLSAIYKRHLNPGLALVGDISVSGGVSRADNFSDRLAMLSENGSLMVLSPMENLNEIQDIPPSILSDPDVIFYSDSQMLLQKAIFSE
jgi:ATP-dependent Lon protease